MHDHKVTVWTHFLPINSNCDNVKHENISVALIFEVGMQVLEGTNCLDVVHICAKPNISTSHKFEV